MSLKVVYTAGVFDLLHRGHLNVLWASAQLGDLLVVGVVSDPGVLAYKHRLPVENVQARMARLARLPFVDVIDVQPTTDPTPLLERYRPDVFRPMVEHAGLTWDRAAVEAFLQPDLWRGRSREVAA